MAGFLSEVGGGDRYDDGFEKLWGAFQNLDSGSLVSAVKGRIGDKEVREDGVDVRTGEVRTGRGHVMVPVVYY